MYVYAVTSKPWCMSDEFKKRLEIENVADMAKKSRLGGFGD
jgi:hypothetical protein